MRLDSLNHSQAASPKKTRQLNAPMIWASNCPQSLAGPPKSVANAPATPALSCAPFQLAPKLPSATNPTLSTPHTPPTPCTESAPIGSSTFMVPSKKRTAYTTSKPATAPVRTAPAGLTKGQEPEMAANPASKPLQTMEGSGLRNFIVTATPAAAAPATEASKVLTAMMG